MSLSVICVRWAKVCLRDLRVSDALAAQNGLYDGFRPLHAFSSRG